MRKRVPNWVWLLLLIAFVVSGLRVYFDPYRDGNMSARFEVLRESLEEVSAEWPALTPALKNAGVVGVRGEESRMYFTIYESSWAGSGSQKGFAFSPDDKPESIVWTTRGKSDGTYFVELGQPGWYLFRRNW